MPDYLQCYHSVKKKSICSTSSERGKRKQKHQIQKKLVLTTGHAISLKEKYILLTLFLISHVIFLLTLLQTHLIENPSQQWNLS